MAFFMMEYLHTQSLPVPHRVSLHLSNVNCQAAKKKPLLPGGTPM
jgi:hypothetical protein